LGLETFFEIFFGDTATDERDDLELSDDEDETEEARLRRAMV
jgi:hypothetical protein